MATRFYHAVEHDAASFCMMHKNAKNAVDLWKIAYLVVLSCFVFGFTASSKKKKNNGFDYY